MSVWRIAPLRAATQRRVMRGTIPRDNRDIFYDEWARLFHPCRNPLRTAACAPMIRFMESRRALTLRIALLSVGIGVFFTAQLVFQGLAAGQPIVFARDILREQLYWLTWAALSPLIVAMVRRWPLDTKPTSVTVARHFGVSAILVPAQTVFAFSLHLFVMRALDPTLQITLRAWLIQRRPVLVWGVFEGAFFYWLIVGVYTVVHYRRLYAAGQLNAAELERHGATLRSELARAQLDALRSQLRPHFLFNTLNAISVLAPTDAVRAQLMLVRLGSLLRRSLDEEEHEVTLRRELAYLRDYIDIQQTRFGDRLVVTEEIDPAILESRVPVFLLQPLVENAIVHGAAERDGVTRIVIRAAREREALRIEIEDNGPGVAPAAEVRRGIGLSNTRGRLQQLRGSAASLTLASVGAPGAVSGARSTIVIPLQEAACAS